jgi:hypothetical protein
MSLRKVVQIPKVAKQMDICDSRLSRDQDTHNYENVQFRDYGTR